MSPLLVLTLIFLGLFSRSNSQEPVMKIGTIEVIFNDTYVWQFIDCLSSKYSQCSALYTYRDSVWTRGFVYATTSTLPRNKTFTAAYYTCETTKTHTVINSFTYDAVVCSIQQFTLCREFSKTCTSLDAAIQWSSETDYLRSGQIINCSSSCINSDTLFLYGKLTPSQSSTIDTSVADITTEKSTNVDSTTQYNTTTDGTTQYTQYSTTTDSTTTDSTTTDSTTTDSTTTDSTTTDGTTTDSITTYSTTTDSTTTDSTTTDSTTTVGTTRSSTTPDSKSTNSSSRIHQTTNITTTYLSTEASTAVSTSTMNSTTTDTTNTNTTLKNIGTINSTTTDNTNLDTTILNINITSTYQTSTTNIDHYYTQADTSQPITRATQLDTTDNSSPDNSDTTIILAVCVTLVIVLVIVFITGFILWRRNKRIHKAKFIIRIQDQNVVNSGAVNAINISHKGSILIGNQLLKPDLIHQSDASHLNAGIDNRNSENNGDYTRLGQEQRHVKNPYNSLLTQEQQPTHSQVELSPYSLAKVISDTSEPESSSIKDNQNETKWEPLIILMDENTQHISTSGNTLRDDLDYTVVVKQVN